MESLTSAPIRRLSITVFTARRSRISCSASVPSPAQSTGILTPIGTRTEIAIRAISARRSTSIISEFKIGATTSVTKELTVGASVWLTPDQGYAATDNISVEGTAFYDASESGDLYANG